MDINETQVIYDLTQKTRQGKLKWVRNRNYDFGDFSNSRIVEAYQVDHKGESLELLVESRVDDEYDTNVFRTITHLWIMDDSGDRLWRFPDNDALEDLLSTVRFQTGKVADRLRKLTED